MNLILFESEAPTILLKNSDPRTEHVRKVLKMSVGDSLFVGAINRNRGKAVITQDNSQGINLDISWDQGFIDTLPLTVIAGTPRPQTARRLLQEGSCIGVKRFYFFNAEKGESSYSQSKLWSSDEWKRHLVQGAEQAFATTIPEVTHKESLTECIKEINTPSQKIALDNYEATQSLSKALQNESTAYTLAIGSERGWSKNERKCLNEAGFALAHIGERVFKMENALIISSGLISSRLGNF